MEFERLFGITCESFGGEVEEEDGILTCVFDEGEHESFKAFAIWLHRNAIKKKEKGEFLAKWTGTGFQGEELVEEFYVRDGKGKLEYKVEDTLGSYESNADWVRDILEEEGFEEEIVERAELNISEAYEEAGRAVDNLDYREASGAPPYIFMRGDVRCEAESDYTYDVERLVCVGEIDVEDWGVLTSMMKDLEKAVAKAVEVAEETWHDTFRSKVKGLARELVAR